MNYDVRPQETYYVARTAVHPTSPFGLKGYPSEKNNWWNILLADLRVGKWLDLTSVLNEFEAELKELERADSYDRRFRATCLAKLRLALIQAQIQIAPETSTMDSDSALLRWVNETAPFFPLFGLRGRTAEDLTILAPNEYEFIKSDLIPAIAEKSMSGRDAIGLAVARLATPPKMIRRTNPSEGRLFGTSVLTPTELGAVGNNLPIEVMRDLYPMFQYFPENRS